MAGRPGKDRGQRVDGVHQIWNQGGSARYDNLTSIATNHIEHRGVEPLTVNVALLTKVMEHIEAHPEEHDQVDWGLIEPCGTKFCFAGHTVAISGYELVFSKNKLSLCRQPGTSEEWFIDYAARAELGISFDEAEHLFYADTAEELRGIVDDLIAQSA